MIARRCLAVAALLATACAPVDEVESPAAEDAPPEAAIAPPAHDDTAALRWVRANACEDQSPMSLTASDGTGLALKSVKARAAVEGPIALTELQLSFDNPEDRQLEGRFAITLPPGAAISRFAMKIDGRWQEGEVVERQAARRAYEDFLHRRQDPALLENDAGNVFRARVFPIPARGEKELIIAYSQTLPAQGEPWRLPLCGLPRLGELDVDVAIVRGAAFIGSSLGGKATSVQHLTLREQDFAPTKDLEAWAGDNRADGVRHGDLAIARIKPIVESSSGALETLTILFDTSASRALDFTGQVDRLGRLTAALAAKHPGLALKVAAFDQDVAPIFDGLASEFGEPELAKLKDRGALGASNLQLALDKLDSAGLGSDRVLLVGDGVATAGDIEAAALTESVKALSKAGVTRFDALVDGGIQDAAMLAQLTREGLATDGIVVDARMEHDAIVAKLGRATQSGITVDVPGAEWVWPRTLDGVQTGDEVLVYAQLPPQQEFGVELGGASLAGGEPVLATVPGPLLGRAHAEARIAAMQTELSSIGNDAIDAATQRGDLQARIVAMSTRHRVLSDYTALLVLETEDDYRRFGIARNALTDIMTVGPAGVDLLSRKSPRPESVRDELLPEEDPPEDPTTVTLKDARKKAGFKLEKETADGVDGDFDEDKGGVEEELDIVPDTAAAAAPKPSEADDDAEKTALEPPSDIPAGIPLGGAQGSGGGEPVVEPEPEPEAPRWRRHFGEEGRMGRPRGNRRGRSRRPAPPPPPPKETPKVANAWDGPFDAIMKDLEADKIGPATRAATQWRKDQPGDVMALVALGEVFEASGDAASAARAYGSLIDLFPSRADLRRMAGERLERLGAVGVALAADTYDKALKSRPDQPSGARLLAYALVKQGKFKEAFATIEAALGRSYPSGRFAQVHRILREDLGLIGKAWIAADPIAEKAVRAAMTAQGTSLPNAPSTRFVLTWETDANDVDLHVYDAKNNHAYYSNKTLHSGGQLYADVTTGYGPECFTIDGKAGAGPYVLQAHYYRRGPMGYGMGKLQVLKHDGNGHLDFSDHPFVIMRDDAFVDLAKVGR
ncbi:MAG: VIT domain-containing protein [Myxococcota bacterium]